MAAFKINDPEMDEWVSKFKEYPEKRADWEARSFGGKYGVQRCVLVDIFIFFLYFFYHF